MRKTQWLTVKDWSQIDHTLVGCLLHVYGWMDGWLVGGMYGWVGGWVGGWMDGWMN